MFYSYCKLPEGREMSNRDKMAERLKITACYLILHGTGSLQTAWRDRAGYVCLWEKLEREKKTMRNSVIISSIYRSAHC
ncbi:hypothetical protein AAFF_G00220540 [Aldrovandia affinis]|uniref:Uncharacterized protein n=1 Tax=Aldrovandia affinis TaxID=143900 RepID=A0AAD7W4T1_9TELE|nr:hypothetical protein AAFF_G00220540 [Aldrovandia affinis]